MKRRKAIKVAGIVAGAMLLLLGILFAAAACMLTPKRLTPLVERLCAEYLEAEVRFDTVAVSLWQDFPYVNLKLRRAGVTSHTFRHLPDSIRAILPDEAENLMQVGSLDLSLHLPALLGGRADIRRIRLEDAHLHAVVAPDGTANWEIYQADPDTEDSDDLLVHINRIIIRNGLHLTYHNAADSLSAEVQLDQLYAGGLLSPELAELDLKRLRLRGLRAGTEIAGQKSRVTLDSLSVDGQRRRQYQVDRVGVYGCRAETELEGKKAGLLLESLLLSSRRRQQYDLKLVGREMIWEDAAWLDSLKLNSRFALHREPMGISVSELDILLNDIPLSASGELELHPDSVSTKLDLSAPGLTLQKVLALLPAAVWPDAPHYSTDLVADAHLSVRGGYHFDRHTLPEVTLDWRMPAGYLRYANGERRAGLDTLALDFTLNYNHRVPDSTAVQLRNFRMIGKGIGLRAHAEARRLLADPLVKVDVKGGVSLSELMRMFPSAEGDRMRGVVVADLQGTFRVSQLTPSRIAETDLRGTLNLDTLRLWMPRQELRLMVGRGRLRVGPNLLIPDSLRTVYGDMVGAEVSVDTVSLRYGRDFRLTGRDALFTVQTSVRNLARDTTAVHPSHGKLEAAGLRVELEDSVTLICRLLTSRWGIGPSPGAARVPRLGIEATARMLSLREPGSRYMVQQGTVALGATLLREDSVQLARREAHLDSLQRLYPAIPRDSLYVHLRNLRGERERPQDGFAGNDIDLQVSEGIGSLLQRWQIGGVLKARSGRIITPYFPIRTLLADVDVTFNTDRVDLNKTFIKAGESQMVLTGHVSGLRRAMLGSGRVQGELLVDADTLNLNELVRVINAGWDLMEAGNFGDIESDDLLEQQLAMSADTASAQMLLIVPGNIDMTFDLRVRHGAYANLLLDSLSGQVIARNRVLQLSDFLMESSAGDIRMSGLYSTRTPQDIHAGFDVEMDRIQIARLIELVPSIDTLMPMLRSFEGVVDCQMAATTQIDTEMNVLLPTLNAACRIVGDSLVLMDGETFAMISKKLMFKNKQRNLIDHVSAEMLVRDSQVEIFPFVLEMDRYRAAVSGVHKLDLTFNYHISVLKSPVPFRLGLDIFGNMDDFDFKITRARYKTAELPSRTEVIDETRLNLRSHIREALRRGPRPTDIASLRITPDAESPDELLPEAEALTEQEEQELAEATESGED